MNRWWLGDPEEIYWLEVTDREDLGVNLQAPKQDDSGRENWRYSLVKEVRPGDVVFHYHKLHESICGRSKANREAADAEIVWGARGSYAREKGVKPYSRPAWRLDLIGFEMLPHPVHIRDIRQVVSALRALISGLETTYGKPLYFPFEMSSKRDARPLQGYLFKLPKAVVHQFPHLVLPAPHHFPASGELKREIDSSLATEEAAHGDTSFVPDPEGKRILREHVTYERSMRNRAEAIRIHGNHCSACGFDFDAFYGAELAAGYIEIHHLESITQTNGPVSPESGLVPLCSNCHSMAHRKAGIILTVAELKGYIQKVKDATAPVISPTQTEIMSI